MPRKDDRWTAPRISLLAAVLAYLGLILAAPLLALLIEVCKIGPRDAVLALTSDQALRSLGLTALVAVIAVVTNLVFGVAAGLVIARQQFLGRRLMDGLIEMPLAISPVMIGLAFILVFGREGVLAPLLEAVDIKVIFSPPGVIIATVFVTVPFTAREVIGVLREIGTSEEQAAMTLGASRWQTFRLVTIPNLKTALSCGVTLTAARSFGEFGAVLVLGGAIAGQTQTATTYIYAAMEERQEAGAYGMSLVLAVLSIGLLVLLERIKGSRREA